jgi:hypothetical protein
MEKGDLSMSSITTLVVPLAEIDGRMFTWKWYVKHELMILALFLVFFGLGWVLLDERVDQVEPDMPAHIQ